MAVAEVAMGQGAGDNNEVKILNEVRGVGGRPLKGTMSCAD